MRQHEQGETVKTEQESPNTAIPNEDTTLNERQVGMKLKRDDYEGDDNEWEEAPPTGNCHHYLALYLIIKLWVHYQDTTELRPSYQKNP